MTENPEVNNLVIRETKSMDPTELKRFRQELLARLPVVVKEAAKAARDPNGQKQEDGKQGGDG